MCDTQKCRDVEIRDAFLMIRSGLPHSHGTHVKICIQFSHPVSLPLLAQNLLLADQEAGLPLAPALAAAAVAVAVALVAVVKILRDTHVLRTSVPLRLSSWEIFRTPSESETLPIISSDAAAFEALTSDGTGNAIKAVVMPLWNFMIDGMPRTPSTGSDNAPEKRNILFIEFPGIRDMKSRAANCVSIMTMVPTNGQAVEVAVGYHVYS